MSIRIAVAGVTNALRHAIVSGLPDESNIQVVLLTRQSSVRSKNLSCFTSCGAVLHPVDYTSLPQPASALVGVETIIVTLYSGDDITPTVNLIQACKAAGMKCFAPSEFVFTSEANAQLDLLEPKRRIWEELKRSGLEYTAFQNVLFMDYFVIGASKKYEGPLTNPDPFVIDVPANKAVIPGTGDEPMSFTLLRDLGRFVASAVKLKDRWPEELDVCSETITFNEIVRHVETATGKKMDVEYMSLGTIQEMLSDRSENDRMKKFYTQSLGLIVGGLGAVPPVLNKLLPEIQVGNAKEFIAEYWSS